MGLRGLHGLPGVAEVVTVAWSFSLSLLLSDMVAR